MNIYRNINLGVTGAVAKASAGRLCGWYVSNAATAARFLKIYNKATAPDQTDTPVLTILIPALSAANVMAPSDYECPDSDAVIRVDSGLTFSAGISVRATTAVADNDTGAPSANDVVVNLFYR